MAVIRGALGDDGREGTGQRDGRGVLWDDDILNGLDEDARFDSEDRSEDDGDRGGGQLYFSAATPETGQELFVYDPKARAIGLAADIREGSADSSPEEITALGGELYFRAHTPETGEELYRYDPQTGEATRVADIAAGPDPSFTTWLTALGGTSRNDNDLNVDAPDDDGDDDAEEAGEALSLAELLDDGAILMDGPAAGAQQPVTHDGATALGAGPSVEALVVAPETVVA